MEIQIKNIKYINKKKKFLRRRKLFHVGKGIILTTLSIKINR